jgi:hypothetical protein
LRGESAPKRKRGGGQRKQREQVGGDDDDDDEDEDERDDEEQPQRKRAPRKSTDSQRISSGSGQKQQHQQPSSSKQKQQTRRPFVDISYKQSPGQSMLAFLPDGEQSSSVVHYEGSMAIQADFSSNKEDKLLNKKNHVLHLDASGQDKENQQQSSGGKQIQGKGTPVPRRPREAFATTINVTAQIGEVDDTKEGTRGQDQPVFPKTKSELNPQKYHSRKRDEKQV